MYRASAHVFGCVGANRATRLEHVIEGGCSESSAKLRQRSLSVLLLDNDQVKTVHRQESI